MKGGIRMPKATITTKTGTKIIIDGTPSEVKEMISHMAYIEGSPRKGAKWESARKSKQSKQKSNTATDIILSLSESGYFNKKRSLLDIKVALEEQGMIYPVTTLSSVLIALVRRRLLGRVKDNKKWCYVKR